MAEAMAWTARITNIALEMALPGVGGFLLDRWLGTLPVFLILGAVLGFVLGMRNLLRLAAANQRRP